MKELKEALLTNYGKRLKRGRCIGHHQRNRTRDAGNRRDSQRTYSSGDLKSVIAASESEAAKENGERILKLIEAVPKIWKRSAGSRHLCARCGIYVHKAS